MIHSNNQVIIEYNDFVQIANEKDQYMDGWWNERNVQSTDFVPTKDTMVYSNYDTISAYRNELHQHSRASSGASDGSTIDGYYGSNTFDGRRTGDVLNQYEISQESPVEWNIEQVVTWMESVGLEAVIDKFIVQEITGDVLFNLDQDSLKELGINTYGRRFKVLNAIDKLKTDTSFCQYRNGSVNENLLLNDTKDNSTFNSHASSPLPRRRELVNHKNASYRVSFPSRINAYRSNTLMDRSNTMDLSKRSKSDPAISQRSKKVVSENLLNLKPSYSTPLPLLNPTKEQEIGYPEHQGWVYKKSNRYKTWNKRWFVLYGQNLFYFKHPTDSRVKGVVHLQGYRVILESSVNSIKRYRFKLHHDNERNFLFYTKTMDDMKKWVQALTKATIKRDPYAPTVSSNSINTVPLDVAQQMKPRPPSTLMYSNKCNANKQFYQEVMEHCDMSEQELNETLLWMEHPIKQGLASQKLMIRPYTNNQNTKDHPYNCQQQQQQKKKKQESDPFLRNKETLVTNNNNIARELLLWVNDWISPTCQVLDLSQSMRTGQVLLQLLEALSAKTIPRCQNQASKSMIMLDNIVEAFKFMNQEGFINNRCTIKDVYCGDEEKIVEMLLDLRAWVEEKYKIDDPLLRSKMFI